jgi:hypothetical protein
MWAKACASKRLNAGVTGSTDTFAAHRLEHDALHARAAAGARRAGACRAGANSHLAQQ